MLTSKVSCVFRPRTPCFLLTALFSLWERYSFKDMLLTNSPISTVVLFFMVPLTMCLKRIWVCGFMPLVKVKVIFISKICAQYIAWVTTCISLSCIKQRFSVFLLKIENFVPFIQVFRCWKNSIEKSLLQLAPSSYVVTWKCVRPIFRSFTWRVDN